MLKELTWLHGQESGGVVHTLYGRRGVYPDLLSEDNELRTRAERQAFNFLIQGTEADIVKLIQLAIFNEITDHSECKQVLQVHDELIYEVVENKAEEFAYNIEQVVTGNNWLPGLVVEGTASIGNNWEEIH